MFAQCWRQPFRKFHARCPRDVRDLGSSCNCKMFRDLAASSDAPPNAQGTTTSSGRCGPLPAHSPTPPRASCAPAHHSTYTRHALWLPGARKGQGGGRWKRTCRQKTSTTASGACSSTSLGMSMHVRRARQRMSEPAQAKFKREILEVND